MMRMHIPSITNNKGWGGVYGLVQERIRMGSLSKTPIEAHSLVKNSLNTGNVFSNNGLCLSAAVQYVLLF